MNDISQRLMKLDTAWKDLKNKPHDLGILGLPGKDSSYIEKFIEELVLMASQLGHIPSKELVMTHCLCESLLSNAESSFSPETMRANPSMRMLSFVALLQQMQTTMKSHLSHSRSNTKVSTQIF